MTISVRNYYLIITAIIMALLVGVLATNTKLSLLFVALYSFAFIVLFFLKYPNRTLDYLGLIVLGGILITRSFYINDLPIRIEDLAVVFIGIFMLYILKSEYKNATITKMMIIYLIYSLMVTIINLGLSDLSFIYFFYLLKEIQFFLYFMLFFYLTNAISSKRYIKFFTALSLATILWGIYQVVFDEASGFYGIGIISETASSQSGGAFFAITLFLVYKASKQKSKLGTLLYAVLTLLSIWMVFATISRTAILATVLVVGVYLFISVIYKKVTPVKTIVSIYIIVVIAPIIYLFMGGFVEKIINRLSRIDQGSSIRSEKWDRLLSYSEGTGAFFGNGKGFTQTITGGFTLSADSQYVRLILEVGWLGLFLWSLIIMSVIVFAIKNMRRNYNESLFILLLTAGFLIMGVTHEVFMVTVQATLYWSLIGIFMGKIQYNNLKNKEHTTQLEQTAN